MSIAPRFADLLAVAALPFAWLLHGWCFWIWSIFWGAGLVDLITGSIGWSDRSDLRRVADGFGPWVLRVAGFSLVVASAAMWLQFSGIAGNTG
jgi:hypothetical protein